MKHPIVQTIAVHDNQNSICSTSLHLVDIFNLLCKTFYINELLQSHAIPKRELLAKQTCARDKVFIYTTTA